jgi:Holliday junction resolvase
MTNSRAKGADYEREVAKALLDLTGIRFVRNLEQVRTEAQGDLVTDVAAWPFTIECKRKAVESRLPTWRQQASLAAAKAGKFPVVVYRFDRQPTRVNVPFEAIGAAFGGAPGDSDRWAEITLPDLAYLAAEIMALDAARPAHASAGEWPWHPPHSAAVAREERP